MDENAVAKSIVDSAYHIHTELGPGLMESNYVTLLAEELALRCFGIRVQQPLSVVYYGRKLEDGFRVDLLVNDLVIVEVKSVEHLADVHFKQVLTYLKLSGKKLGLLINFNEALIKDGIKRMANGMP